MKEVGRKVEGLKIEGEEENLIKSDILIFFIKGNLCSRSRYETKTSTLYLGCVCSSPLA